MAQSEASVMQWTRIRAKGRLRFILVYGVLLFGGGSFIVNTVGPVLFGFPFERELSGASVVISAGVFAFFGWLLGGTMWYLNERKYGKSDAG